MNWWGHFARLVIELAVAWAAVTALAFVVMVTMFWFGPWANPPGIDEGHAVAIVAVTIVCLWRAYVRVARHRDQLRSAAIAQGLMPPG